MAAMVASTLGGMRAMNPRDPWLLVAFLGTTIVGAWLASLGPLPFDVWDAIKHWQTLIGASVAVAAACIAYWNTTRSLRQAAELEQHRRQRKHEALRAVLPLALSELLDYAQRSAHALDGLLSRCQGQALQRMTASADLAQPLPEAALKMLEEFIEYSDTVDVTVLLETIAWVQIFDDRVQSLVAANRNPSSTRIIVQIEIEGYVIDAASIYAGAVSIFDYARRRSQQLPGDLSWQAVIDALMAMDFRDHTHPDLFKIITGRQGHTRGPFHRLR